MKLYRVASGILIENEHRFVLLAGEDWDTFVNDDALFEKTAAAIRSRADYPNGATLLREQLLVPAQGQEIWAAGVTYYRSKVGRQEESKAGGGSDFYARVYEADRPELFFKSLPHRAVAHGEKVRIRRDSDWNVPEPELTLMLSSSGKIIAYTRECSFPCGALLMTGTGIVPGSDFTLYSGDEVRITIDPIGTLVNVVA